MGACFCSGACRLPPYCCPAGDFSSRYDPNYEDRLRQEGAMRLFLELSERVRKQKKQRPTKDNPIVAVPVEERERERMLYDRDDARRSHREHLHRMAEPEDLRELRRQAERIEHERKRANERAMQGIEMDRLRRKIREAGEQPCR